MGSRTRRLRRLLIGASLLIALVASTACWGNNPQDTLAPRGPVARDQKALFYVAFWIAVVIFFAVEGMLLFAVIRYRRRRGQDRLPRQIHGNTRIEVIWTIAPTLLLAVLCIPTVAMVYNLAPKHTADSIQVQVVGHQWWWEFRYPDLGVVTANELHIPPGRRINLELDSVDVIHAFYVPSLAGQVDVVPRPPNAAKNTMWIQADNPGTYLGQCTQFCGTSHAFMRFQVIADPNFDGWVAAQKAPPVPPSDATAQGAQTFATGKWTDKQQQCINCHAITGVSVGNVGPNLTHFASRSRFAGSTLENTPENVRKWLHNPQSVKPEAIMPNLRLTDEELDNLVQYLESLK